VTHSATLRLALFKVAAQTAPEPKADSDVALSWLERIFGKANPDAKALREFNVPRILAGDVSPRAIMALPKLQAALKEHQLNPQLGKDRIDTLPRSMIEGIDGGQLEDLGFLKSRVAVPERGQSQLATYRHPATGMHLHKHDDKWIFHVDAWPSMQMQRENGKITGKKPVYSDGVQHALLEGIPGYYNYGMGTILGTPDFKDLIENPNLSTAPSLGRASAGIATAIGVPALIAALLARKGDRVDNARATGGAIAGGMAGLRASKAIRGLSRDGGLGDDPRVRFLTDTAGLFGGGYLGYRALRKNQMNKKRKKEAALLEQAQDASKSIIPHIMTRSSLPVLAGAMASAHRNENKRELRDDIIRGGVGAGAGAFLGELSGVGLGTLAGHMYANTIPDSDPKALKKKVTAMIIASMIGGQAGAAGGGYLGYRLAHRKKKDTDNE